MPVSLEAPFRCPVCAGTIVELDDGYDDTTLTSCRACGAELGRWGDIKNAEKSLVSDKAEQTLKAVLGSLPEWNLKP